MANSVHKGDSIILLTGATGYVGGRLLRVLEEEGYDVRCLTRRPKALEGRVSNRTEVVKGDVLDKESLDKAMTGIATAYYLVHSMGSLGDFEEEETQGARNFAESASASGVRRIIYLGGLGEGESGLSAHLRSRQRVGDILRTSSAQVIEFRASIIVGSGGISFEMVRALVERLPVMITPRWVATLAQPIAINDLLHYLKLALGVSIEGDRVFEVGGADVVSYGGLMEEYARQRGLRRFMMPVPVLTPRLSSLWLGLVTPVYARVGRKLVDSLRHSSVVHDDSVLQVFDVRPMGIREAISEAMRNEDRGFSETRWSDALSSAGRERQWGGVRFGTRLVDTRMVAVDATPHLAFEPVRRIGGNAGWYFGDILWKIRGFMDLLAGGVGVRRGRRDPEQLAVGDTVDWWRVERYEPDRLLRLSAEMKVPGRAWLEFEVEPEGDGSVIRQTAEFDPLGLPGLAYWYLLWPLHNVVFAGMSRGIAQQVNRLRNTSGASPQ
jgi:uncharacterized protein YbjT (DUF2867 family)